MLPDAQQQELEATLNRAAKVYNRALAAHERKRFGREHQDALTKAECDIAQLLAYYEDGEGWGVLCPSILANMLDYCDDAVDLLDEAAPMLGRRQERLRVGLDRWVVTRVITVNGIDYLNERACTNPAVGLLQLDAWEDELRTSLHVRLAA